MHSPKMLAKIEANEAQIFMSELTKDIYWEIRCLH